MTGGVVESLSIETRDGAGTSGRNAAVGQGKGSWGVKGGSAGKVQRGVPAAGKRIRPPMAGAKDECDYEGCDRPDKSVLYYHIQKGKEAGGQDWSPLVGKVLCKSCYSRFMGRGTLERIRSGSPERARRSGEVPTIVSRRNRKKLNRMRHNEAAVRQDVAEGLDALIASAGQLTDRDSKDGEDCQDSDDDEDEDDEQGGRSSSSAKSATCSQTGQPSRRDRGGDSAGNEQEDARGSKRCRTESDDALPEKLKMTSELKLVVEALREQRKAWQHSPAAKEIKKVEGPDLCVLCLGQGTTICLVWLPSEVLRSTSFLVLHPSSSAFRGNALSPSFLRTTGTLRAQGPMPVLWREAWNALCTLPSLPRAAEQTLGSGPQNLGHGRRHGGAHLRLARMSAAYSSD